MHVVIWTIGEDRYATPTRDVVEVTSVVDVRDVPRTEPWVCGLMNYRSQLIPLIDLSLLLGRGPAKRQLYARILVVKVGDDAETERLGLLVESVLGGENLDFNSAKMPCLQHSSLAFLGPVTLLDDGSVQLTDATQIKMPAAKADPA